MQITYNGIYLEMDWTLSTGALAEASGLDKATVSRLRKKYAPETAMQQRSAVDQSVAGFANVDAFLAACAERAGVRVGGYEAVGLACGVNGRTVGRWFAKPPVIRPSPAILARLVEWWEGTARAVPAGSSGAPVEMLGKRHRATKTGKIAVSAEVYTALSARAKRANVSVDVLADQILRVGLDVGRMNK